MTKPCRFDACLESETTTVHWCKLFGRACDGYTVCVNYSVEEDLFNDINRR